MNERDVYPITIGNPPTTLPSRAGATFQVQPLVWKQQYTNTPTPIPPNGCDPALPQTPHRAGMCVGMADGSVRTISGSISPATFWAMVTPAGGEVLGIDW